MEKYPAVNSCQNKHVQLKHDGDAGSVEAHVNNDFLSETVDQAVDGVRQRQMINLRNLDRYFMMWLIVFWYFAFN